MNELPLFEKSAVRLYLGCCCERDWVEIRLELKNVESFSANDLHLMKVKENSITGVRAGPRTVVELFEGRELAGKRRVVINSSYDRDKTFDIGCVEDHLIWEGYVRSIRVYAYEYYMALYGIRYCDSDSECGFQEYCLCPNGSRHKEWCLKKGKRCMHMSKYLQMNKPELVPNDVVKNRCVRDKLGEENRYVTFSKVHDISNDCVYGRELPMYEGFANAPSNNKIQIFLILLVLFYFLTKYNVFDRL